MQAKLHSTQRVLALTVFCTPVTCALASGQVSQGPTPTVAAATLSEPEETAAPAPLEILAEPSVTRSLFGAQDMGVTFGALVRGSFQSIPPETGLLNDLDENGDVIEIDGFALQDADLWMEGGGGDVSWRVSLEGDGSTRVSGYDGDSGFIWHGIESGLAPGDVRSGGPLLEDAYGVWRMSDNMRLQFGGFKAPTSLSNQIDPENMVLHQRSIVGHVFEEWDMGVMLSTAFGSSFAAYIAAQNGGVIAQGDGNYRITARGEFRINGGFDGGNGGGGDGVSGTVGLTVQDRGDGAFNNWNQEAGTSPDSDIFLVDTAFAFGSFGLHGELVNLGEDVGDGDIFSLTGSWNISDSWLAAIRFETLDMEVNPPLGITPGGAGVQLDKLTAGVSVKHGAGRWNFNISQHGGLQDSDGNDYISAETGDPLDGGAVLEIGFTLGSSR